jgi:putative membrane protein
MILRLALATLHLLALAIGLGAVWTRARAFGGALDSGSIRRGLSADSWWGVAAALWIATGVWRLVAGTEKAPAYYVSSAAFVAKMILFATILALEIWPMTTLIRWRVAIGRGAAPEPVVDPMKAVRIALLSRVEAVLVVAMVVAATAMARGYFAAG